MSVTPLIDPVMTVEGHNYSYVFNFEKVMRVMGILSSVWLSMNVPFQDFEHSIVRVWMEDNWRPVCAWASGIYMLLIFGGQTYMASRSACMQYLKTSDVTTNSFQASIWPERSLDSLEYVLSNIQYNGGGQDHAGVYSHFVHSGVLSLTMHSKVGKYRFYHSLCIPR